MSDTFRAFFVDKRDDRYDASIRDLTLADLPDEPVLVDVAYSSLNYKDGLAVTGKLGIVRSFPMVCGIDLAGTVIESAHPAFAPGDRVLVNGWGLSESHWGGYSQKQRVKAEFLTRVRIEPKLLQSIPDQNFHQIFQFLNSQIRHFPVFHNVASSNRKPLACDQF